jgi:predicted  nucleic acid-binding Zn-ribbon protein
MKSSLLLSYRQYGKYCQPGHDVATERMSQQAHSSRETVVALESTIKELTRHNAKLESDLANQVESQSELQATLEEKRARAASIEREFIAYQEAHRLSGDLGALQEAVAGLQAQLRDHGADDANK